MTRLTYLSITTILLFSIFALASAGLPAIQPTYLRMTEPYNATIYNNATVYLGNVGPGQTFYVTVSAQTTNSAGVVINQGWNELLLSGVPNGWVAENSPLYSDYPSVKITPSPNAPNGTFTFELKAVNVGNYSKVGNLTFTAHVNVTPRVFSLSAYPSMLDTGIGQPAEIHISINNTGVSDTPFVISVVGLPAWEVTQTVIAPHHTTRQFSYEVYANESGVYQLALNVNSTATPLIHQQSNITLVVKPTLLSDYKAIGQGSLSFPVVYAPVYAVMYLIRLLIH